MSQLKLLEWLEFYKRIDELGDDKPEQFIIDDDNLMDDWFKRYVAGKKKDRQRLMKGKKDHQNKHTFY